MPVIRHWVPVQTPMVHMSKSFLMKEVLVTYFIGKYLRECLIIAALFSMQQYYLLLYSVGVDKTLSAAAYQ